MIARLQATWTIFLLLCAAAWLAFSLPRSPALAAWGLAAAAVSYLGVMALQFTLMQRVNRADPA
ncbi:MAG: permease, partial [Giesbergeria sp.]